MDPVTAVDLLRGLVMLKISPLLIHQIMRIAKTTVVPSGMCPAFIWPFEMSRISPALANQIMVAVSRFFGI